MIRNTNSSLHNEPPRHNLLKKEEAIKTSAVSIENAKISKDRINTLRNAFKFSSSDEDTSISHKEKARSRSHPDDEKDTCDGSDTDSVTEIKPTSIVHTRINSYGSPSNVRKFDNHGHSRWRFDNDQQCDNEIEYKLTRKIPQIDEAKCKYSNQMKSTDNLINTHIIKSRDRDSGLESNIILGNKDVLKLLSNRHLANLNIKVDKTSGGKPFKTGEYKLANSFLATKTGVRTSFRSCTRYLKPTIRSPISQDLSSDEKGMSDSTLKESETETTPSPTHEDIPHNKLGSISSSDESPQALEAVQRNPSSSPIEKAPVIKKLTSGTRMKKDIEAKTSTVNRSDSVKGQRTLRRNSFLRSNKPKGWTENDTRNQPVRLRKRNSRCSKNAEYRISLTIKPSTVADLTNKFNSMSQKQNNGKSEIQYYEHANPGMKMFSSPRASFKRKYRHKASKVSKDFNASQVPSLEPKTDEGHYIAVPLVDDRSLEDTFQDLTVKKFIENENYNKTDEEKVCEKIKTALSSSKFVEETDESDEDQEKCPQLEEEASHMISREEVDEDKKIHSVSDAHCKSSSIDSGILVENDRGAVSIEKIASTEELQSKENAGVTTLEASNIDLVCKTNLESSNNNDCTQPIDISRQDSDKDMLVNKSDLQEQNLEKKSKEDSQAKDFSIENTESSGKNYQEVKQTTKSDSKIYSTLKTVVKSTLKPGKDKEGVTKDTMKPQKISKEKKRWFSRARSKERKRSTDEDSKHHTSEVSSEGNKAVMYEKLTFKRSVNEISSTNSDGPTSLPESLNTNYEEGSNTRKSMNELETQNESSPPLEKEYQCGKSSGNKDDLTIESKNKPTDFLSKKIPPPPKTPIPSPPLPFKRFFSWSKTKKPKDPSSEKDGSNIDMDENVYENLQTLEIADRERCTSGRSDILPNPSFLWSTNIKSPSGQTKLALDYPAGCSKSHPEGDDRTSCPELYGTLSSCVTPNIAGYSEIGPSIPGYDQIGGNSAVSYDEIEPPSSCGYDDVLPPAEFMDRKCSQEGYDSVSPPKSEIGGYDDVGIVTAKLVVVKEDQMESICYAYDDIGAYNESRRSNSYEPVCPPEDKTAISTEKHTNECSKFSMKLQEEIIDSDDSERIHEVLSYEITTIPSTWTKPEDSSVSARHGDAQNQHSSPNAGHQNYKQEKIMEMVLHQKLMAKTQIRTRPRYPIKTRRSTWTQGYRRFIDSNRHNTSTSRMRVHKKNIHSKNSRQDSENEDQGGHYEAIYEVINPEKKTDNLNGEVSDGYQDNDDFDDSFDSEESDEDYARLQPSISDAPTHGEPYPSNRPENKFDRSQSHQPHSMTKIAEAANTGMKRLRRNWSYTKHEVKTGINKIKKKSAFSMPDIKATESTLSIPSSSSTTDKSKSWSLKSHFRRKSTSSVPAELSKLSLAPSQSMKKDKVSPTFYLTLTLSSDSQEEGDSEVSSDVKMRRKTEGHPIQRRKSATPSISSTSTSASGVAGPSYQKSRSSSHVPVRSVSSRSSAGLSRPTTAPPDPPLVKSASIENNSDDISKDALAIRLNQILSSGPVYPKGRNILKSPESPGSDGPSSLVISKNKHTPKTSSIKYSSVSCSSRLSENMNIPQEILSSVQSNTPETRFSIASSSSNTSSEGYIRPSDIASAPPPLPARPASGSHSFKRHSTPPLRLVPDLKSYLDLETNEFAEPTYISSHFPHEPLYQFYTAKVERAALYQGETSEDDYEVINDGTPKNGTKTTRPTAMELVSPAYGKRTLWCELPEVLSSGILNNITSQDRKIQEAMFEVMTSEASYLKSLEILVTHFMNCPEFNMDDESIICKQEAKILFSDILPVKKCSETFLADLEERWQESVQISKITDIILKNSESFNVYIKYCSNQIYQDRMLRKLKENNPRFVEVLSRLESSPACQSLAMHSFLMLPMQRITRLPLLFDAIFNRLEYGSLQWQECKSALASLTKVVAECNEGARKMERMEEMLLVSCQLDFREVKAIPLISASRWLVKRGELTRLTWRENDAKLNFGRKISKQSLYFFLFSDLLVVTKRKSDDQHLVLDYCPRNMVQVLELETANRFPGRILEGYKNLLIMTMLHNHENKTVEMVLSCPLESDRSRWIEAVTPRMSENPDERIYEEWDCPQVQSVHPYVAMQPDELSLEISDVINVLKKTSDGWYHGERLRDGEKGWFPGNHTVEVASAHVRARNLRQRYRLLVISGSFIEKEKKERDEKVDKKKERRKTATIKETL